MTSEVREGEAPQGSWCRRAGGGVHMCSELAFFIFNGWIILVFITKILKWKDLTTTY